MRAGRVAFAAAVCENAGRAQRIPLLVHVVEGRQSLTPHGVQQRGENVMADSHIVVPDAFIDKDEVAGVGDVVVSEGEGHLDRPS